ncbi:hypothetical protein TURU_028507 [Turdus rufiventris]|nr:hypothetical protein TURU_028507 [Turdus rufiventris]
MDLQGLQVDPSSTMDLQGLKEDPNSTMDLQGLQVDPSSTMDLHGLQVDPSSTRDLQGLQVDPNSTMDLHGLRVDMHTLSCRGVSDPVPGAPSALHSSLILGAAGCSSLLWLQFCVIIFSHLLNCLIPEALPRCCCT